MPDKDEVHVIKVATKPGSRQKTTEEKHKIDYIKPPIDFKNLTTVAEDSFIIGWIIDKIASGCATGFEKLAEDQKKRTEQEQKLYDTLHSFDLKHAFAVLATYGNVFLEIIDNEVGKVFLDPFITETMKIKTHKEKVKNEEGEEVEKSTYKYYQVVWSDKVPFEPEEVVHIKRPSLSSKYFGDSLFGKCVDQIVLLTEIDKYYNNLFDRGMLNTQLLCDPTGKLTQKNRKALETTIQDMVKWNDNSFTTAIVPTELKSLKLENDADTKAFLEYRKELKKDISIGMNIPYDLLESDNSNRSTSEVAFEMLNKTIIKPLQQAFVRQMREQLRPIFKDLVDRIALIEPDTKNQKEEMEVWTGYKKAWILTSNEVREKLWEKPHEEGDRLETSNEKSKEVSDIEKSIKKMYDKTVFNKKQPNV